MANELYGNANIKGQVEVFSPVGNDGSFDGDVKARGFALIGGEGNALIDDYGGSVSINTVKHYTGYCDTAGTVAQKDVSLDDNKGFSLTNGVKILIHLQYANTVASAITMQVDYLPIYKSVYYKNGTAVSGSLAAGIYELEYYDNAWYILNAETSSGGSNTDISYANSKISKTVNGVTSDVVTAADLVKDGLTVGSATGNGNVVSSVAKNASTGALEVTKDITAVTNVTYDTNSNKFVKSVGNTNTDIVTLNNLLYNYGKVRKHHPVYINHTTDLSGVLNNITNSSYAVIFSADEYENDTIIIEPFNEEKPMLDFSALTKYITDTLHTQCSVNRIHVYIMNSKDGVTIKGAVVNNPLKTSGSHSDPGVVTDSACKIECYFNLDYGYWFVEVTAFTFVYGQELSLKEYNDIVEIK